MNGPPANAPLPTPTLPPFSTTMTLLPARTASTAAHKPAPPAPTTTMSHSRVSSAVFIVAASLASESAAALSALEAD